MHSWMDVSGWGYGGPQEAREWGKESPENKSYWVFPTTKILNESRERVQGSASSVLRQAAQQQAAVQAAQRALEDSGPAVSLLDFQQGKVHIVSCFLLSAFFLCFCQNHLMPCRHTLPCCEGGHAPCSDLPPSQHSAFTTGTILQPGLTQLSMAPSGPDAANRDAQAGFDAFLQQASQAAVQHQRQHRRALRSELCNMAGATPRHYLPVNRATECRSMQCPAWPAVLPSVSSFAGCSDKPGLKVTCNTGPMQVCKKVASSGSPEEAEEASGGHFSGQCWRGWGLGCPAACAAAQRQLVSGVVLLPCVQSVVAWSWLCRRTNHRSDAA